MYFPASCGLKSSLLVNRVAIEGQVIEIISPGFMSSVSSDRADSW